VDVPWQLQEGNQLSEGIQGHPGRAVEKRVSLEECPAACLPPPSAECPAGSDINQTGLFTVTFWRMPPKDESGCACCRKILMQSLVGQF